MKFSERILIIAALVLIPSANFYNAINPAYFVFFRDTIYTSFFSALFSIWFIIMLFKHGYFFKLSYIDKSVLLFWLYVTVNMFINAQDRLFSDEYLLLLSCVILYFALKQYLAGLYNNKINIEPALFGSLLFTGILPVFISILELLKILHPFNNNWAVCGGFMNPGAAAIYISIFIPFNISILLFEKKLTKVFSAFLISVIVLSITILLLSNSRTSWIALMMVSIFILFIYKKNLISILFAKIKHLYIKLPLGIIIIGLSIVLIAFLYRLKKDSADGRIFVWKISIKAITEKPFLGHGFGSFINIYNNSQVNYFKSNPNDLKNGLLAASGIFAFNDYLQITVEEGIIGLLIFLVIFLFAFRVKNTNSIIIAGKASLIAFLVTAMFSYPMESSSNLIIVFILLAFISAFELQSQKVKFNKLFYLFGSLIIICAFVLIVRQVNTYYNCIKWRKAYAMLYVEKKEAIKMYKIIFPSLLNSAPFLSNYASIQLSDNDYSGSILTNKLCFKINTTYESILIQAKNYKAIGDILNEEKYLLFASNLIPHRFIPKYNLFKLYQQSNQPLKAIVTAKLIRDMKIKIFSEEVGKMKAEAIEYLKSNNVE